MGNTIKKKYLSLHFEENLDIMKLGNKTCIVAGVGSGKNRWVEKELIKYGNVLLITSRRARVDETLGNEELDVISENCENNEKSIFKGKYTANDYDNYVMYTNSKMELVLKNSIIYGTNDSFCDSFDYIVLDEAHSLITDSTFTDAPFHIWSFIKRMANKKKFILLTGTINPIQQLLDEDGWEIIDCMDECYNIKPETIIIDKQKNIFENMKRENKTDNKMIYMANSATNISKPLYEKIQKECKIDKQTIAFSMSDSKSESLLKKDMPIEYERLKETYESITKVNIIPDNIKLLLTTSRLKEGINIKNEDIEEIFCESHIAADLLQFSGRVRKGVKKLYIVGDAKQNYINEDYEIDYQFCREEGLTAANNYLNNIQETFEDMFSDILDIVISKTLTNKEISNFVSYIEKRLDHIRYNHMENKFELYELRHTAVKQIEDNMTQYDNNRKEYIKRTFDLGDDQVVDKLTDIENHEIIVRRFYKENFEDILWRLYEKDIKIFGDTKKHIKNRIAEQVGLNKNAHIDTINEEIAMRNIPYIFHEGRETKKENRNLRFLEVLKIAPINKKQ